MPEYTLTRGGERDELTDEEGRTIEEILDENERKEQVKYTGGDEVVTTEFVEDEGGGDDGVECTDESCGELFDTEKGMKVHRTQVHDNE